MSNYRWTSSQAPLALSRKESENTKITFLSYKAGARHNTQVEDSKALSAQIKKPALLTSVAIAPMLAYGSQRPTHGRTKLLNDKGPPMTYNRLARNRIRSRGNPRRPATAIHSQCSACTT